MAANAVDERLFFASKVGGTIRMGVDATARKLSADFGPLAPGKYFVQLFGAVTCWVKTGPVDLADAVNQLPNPTGAVQNLVPEFFLDPTNGIKSFTFHVRKAADEGHVYAVASAAGTLLITKTGE